MEAHTRFLNAPVCLSLIHIFTTVVAPSFRPDKALNIDKAGWKEYITKLAEVCGCEIKDSAALECALASRIDHFDAAGCRASDHGLDYVIYRPADRAAVDMVFSKGCLLYTSRCV